MAEENITISLTRRKLEVIVDQLSERIMEYAGPEVRQICDELEKILEAEK